MRNNQTTINFLLGILLFMLGGILWFVRYVITTNSKEHDGQRTATQHRENISDTR